MPNLRANQTVSKLLGSVVIAALTLAACGSNGTDDAAETAATNRSETSLVEAETTDSTADSTNPDDQTETEDDTEAAEGQVIVNDVVFNIPEGWTSVNKGEDVERALEENNPEVLAALEANGQLDVVKTVTNAVDWLGIPPEGGSVNIVWAPTSEATTPISEVAAGVRSGVESRGFTITTEEAFTSPIGDGVRITFDTVSPSDGSTGGESLIIRVEERLVLITSDAMNADQARSQLELILNSAEIKA